VVPVIEAIRKAGIKTPISIDTFRADVAKAAVDAGANFINDVSGGTRDPDMLAFMASSSLPVCLMHMRGDSKSMMSLTAYEGGDVVGDIRKTLRQAVDNAIRAGVKRWNIILDPGLGFAKTSEQSYEVIRKLPQMFHSVGNSLQHDSNDLIGFPSLVGPSRKAFIGKVVGKSEGKNRVCGTAAACSALIANGADVLRVHDVAEMTDVVLVSDAIWRR
jgi:dihydroneopterin aldolase / 2-amino-4-hydroxy-6-hydroxymethyldihydropteridine diphosphokinase / dihydropteroate synthase